MKRQKLRSKPFQVEKVIDEEMEVECSQGRGKIREEVWQNTEGTVVRYNLAFINPFICSKDNGRVLGYDSSHGHHHIAFHGPI